MGVKIIETNLKRTFLEYKIKKPHQHWVFAVTMWSGTDLNRRHEDFQSSALPTELPDLRYREYKYSSFSGNKKILFSKKLL